MDKMNLNFDVDGKKMVKIDKTQVKPPKLVGNLVPNSK